VLITFVDEEGNMASVNLKYAESGGLKIAYRPVGRASGITARIDKSLIAVACGGQLNLDDIGGPVMEVDVRGQGESEAPRDLDGFSIKGYAADMLSVASAAGVKAPIMLGYSHGADAATLAALEEPRRVRALVLIEPALLIGKKHFEQRLKLIEAGKLDEALNLTFKFANPKISSNELKAAVANAKEFYGNSGASFRGETLARLHSPIDKGRLATLGVPTLVIGGALSSIRSSVARVAKTIPNASVVWIEGADHFLSGKTKQVMQVVTSFVDSLD
jgi:pimeloyl-ACP methyl ester carboxylesterase